MNEGPAIAGVAFEPINGSGLAFRSTLGPDVFEGIGEATKEAENGCGIVMADATGVFAVGDIERVMRAVLYAPTLLLQTQPFGLAELAGVS